MAIPANLITWSDLQVSKKDNIFGKIGVGIEDRSVSLSDGTRKTVLDVSVWFWSNKPFIQEKGHKLIINEIEKEALPIQTTKPEETIIIYFETLSFDKPLSGYLNEDNIEMSDILIDVILSNVNNFEEFKVTGKVTGTILNSYFITFIQEFSETDREQLNISMKKYHNYPFYLYQTDFTDYTKIIIKNDIEYELDYIENKNLGFEYDLQQKQSEVITQNDNLSFDLVYKEKKYIVTYDGNGGETQEGDAIIMQDKNVAAPTFLKEGYTQIGWSYSPSIYGELIELESLPKNKDITLYAKWKQNDITITYYKDNNSIPEIQSFKDNESIIISSDVPQKEKGYIFLRWNGSDGLYYYPGEVVSLSKNLVLTAEWEEQTYKILYVLPNGEEYEETFLKGYGKVSEINGCRYFSYTFDNDLPDKQAGDSLKDGNYILYGMTYSEVNIEYNYNNKTYIDTKNVYNHGNILKNYKPRQSMLYVINNNGNKEYFQYWIGVSGQIYSPNLYYDIPLTIDNNGNAEVIQLEAVYRENENIEHNIFITKDNGISLIAEDFQEDDTLTKSTYILEKDDNTQQAVNGFIFFKQGEVTAKQFNETNEEVDYNIGSKETGIFNFNNYIQEAQLKKQLLQISLNELDNEGLGYVVLDDVTEASTNDDIYISL